MGTAQIQSTAGSAAYAPEDSSGVPQVGSIQALGIAEEEPLERTTASIVKVDHAKDGVVVSPVL